MIVLNHTLFFTLLSSAEELLPDDANFLFPRDFLIVDEAHTIENVAARAAGLRLSEAGLRFELQRLYNPRSRKGQFVQHGDPSGVRAVTDAVEAMETFFRAVEASSSFPNQYSREFRVREPALVEDTLSLSLARIAQRAIVCGDEARGEHTRLEFHEMAKRLKATQLTIKNFLEQEEDGHVYWVERSGGESKAITLQSAPVDVSEYLQNLFFRGDRACVLTSATLGVGEGEDLSYFRKRVGAMQSAAVKLESPFDFQTQMNLYQEQELTQVLRMVHRIEKHLGIVEEDEA